jgi:hypothetical protein
MSSRRVSLTLLASFAFALGKVACCHAFHRLRGLRVGEQLACFGCIAFACRHITSLRTYVRIIAEDG